MPRRKSITKTLSSCSVLYFNARSLNNKIDELCIRCKRYNPDDVVITETWFDPSLPDSLLSIENYVILRCDRDASGGGIAIFLRNSLFYKRLDTLCASNLKSNFLGCILPDLGLCNPLYLPSLLGKFVSTQPRS